MHNRFDARIRARQVARSQPEPLPDAVVPELPARGTQATGKQTAQAGASGRRKLRRDTDAVGGCLQLLGILVPRATA
jgi:hypothetical protein